MDKTEYNEINGLVNRYVNAMLDHFKATAAKTDAINKVADTQKEYAASHEALMKGIREMMV